jgi:hypothetical protein
VNTVNTKPDFYGAELGGNCNIRTNADYNGVMNILQRGVRILSTLRGFLTYPEPLVIIGRNKMIMKKRVSSEMKEPPLL